MQKEIDFKVINATFNAIAPIVEAHGATKEDVEQYVYYLLFIAGAMSCEIGMDSEAFKAYAVTAFNRGKIKSSSVN